MIEAGDYVYRLVIQEDSHEYLFGPYTTFSSAMKRYKEWCKTRGSADGTRPSVYKEIVR